MNPAERSCRGIGDEYGHSLPRRQCIQRAIVGHSAAEQTRWSQYTGLVDRVLTAQGDVTAGDGP